MILSQFISDLQFVWRYAHAEVEIFAPRDGGAIYFFSERAIAEQRVFQAAADRLPGWAYRLATSVPGPGWAKQAQVSWVRNPLRIWQDYRTARKAIRSGFPAAAMAEIQRLPTALVSIAARQRDANNDRMAP